LHRSVSLPIRILRRSIERLLIFCWPADWKDRPLDPFTGVSALDGSLWYISTPFSIHFFLWQVISFLLGPDTVDRFLLRYRLVFPTWGIPGRHFSSTNSYETRARAHRPTCRQWFGTIAPLNPPEIFLPSNNISVWTGPLGTSPSVSRLGHNLEDCTVSPFPYATPSSYLIITSSIHVTGQQTGRDFRLSLRSVQRCGGIGGPSYDRMPRTCHNDQLSKSILYSPSALMEPGSEGTSVKFRKMPPPGYLWPYLLMWRGGRGRGDSSRQLKFRSRNREIWFPTYRIVGIQWFVLEVHV
jgi:hypothetical protein